MMLQALMNYVGYSSAVSLGAVALVALWLAWPTRRTGVRK